MPSQYQPWANPDPQSIVGLNSAMVYGENIQFATGVNHQIAVGSNLQLCINPGTLVAMLVGARQRFPESAEGGRQDSEPMRNGCGSAHECALLLRVVFVGANEIISRKLRSWFLRRCHLLAAVDEALDFRQLGAS